tara:strand:+ start:194 stop:469 length:276 start_codon:yes stop_codon:yes gene_type:complete
MIESSNKILGIHYNIVLLESLGWNEEELEVLVNYVINFLDKIESPNIENIKSLLSSVEDRWGKAQREVIEKIITMESFYLNLGARINNNVN